MSVSYTQVCISRGVHTWRLIGMNTFYQLYACYTYGVYPKYTQMRITLCILNIYTSSITAFFHSGCSVGLSTFKRSFLLQLLLLCDLQCHVNFVWACPERTRKERLRTVKRLSALTRREGLVTLRPPIQRKVHSE